MFGQGQIDALAREIALIGPFGRQIDRAIRAIPSPRAREIFDFLDKNGLLETHHGGGKVVYLKRG